MDESVKAALKELIDLQKSQMTMMSSLAMGQMASRQSNAPQQNMGAPGGYSSGNPFQNHYATQSSFNMPNPMNTVNSAFAGFQSSMGNLAGRNSHYGPVQSLYPDPTRVSDEMRSRLSQDYGQRVANAGLQGTKAAVAAGSMFAPMMMGSGIGGMIGFAGAGLVGGAIIDNAQDQMKQNQSLQKYLARESYRFINSNESVNDRGMAGFSRGQTNEASTFVREINTSFGIKNEEMMKLLQGYTEGGLLKDVTDLKSFKEKIADLTKNVKTGALLLNETFDSITDLLSEMKKSGISQKNYGNIMSTSKVIGAEIGKDASEVARNFINNAANNTQGTGNSTDVYLNRAQDTTMYTNSMYEDLSHRDPKNLSSRDQSNINMVKNLGGADQAGLYLQQIQDNMLGAKNKANTTNSLYGLAFYDYNDKSKEFDFNQQAYNSFIKGNKSMEELTGMVTTKMDGLDLAGKKEWMDNSTMYIRNNNSVNSMDYLSTVNKGFQVTLKNSGLDGSADSAMDYTAPGLDVDSRMLLSGAMSYKEQNGDAIGKKMRINSALLNLDATAKANNLRLPERIAGGWENFKEGMASPFVALGTMVADKVQDLSDDIYGTPFSGFNLSSGVKNISSLSAINSTNRNNGNSIAGMGSTLSKLKSMGFNISGELISGLSSYGDSGDNTFSYERDIIKDPSKLSKEARDSYGTIKAVGKESNLSESILAALVKFGSTQEGKKLFGASESTISEIAKRNNMTVNDVTKAKVEDQLKMVGDYLSKMTVDFGGNNTLALNSFFGGQGNIDAALTAAGIDVGALRKSGRQGELQNVNQGDINVDKTVVNNTSYVGGGGTSNSGGGSGTDTGGTGSGKVKGSSVKGGTVYTGDYADMDLSIPIDATAEQLDAYIASKAPKGSKMLGQGATYLEAQKLHGVNALALIDHAALETAWGTSNIVKNKNNFYGIGAFDASPGESAYTYSSVEDGIIAGAKFIGEKYVKKGQNTFRKMNHNNGVHEYATDDEWYRKNADTMQAAPEHLRNGIRYGGEVVYDEGPSYDGNVTKETVHVNATTGQYLSSEEFKKLEEKFSEEKSLLDLADQSWLGEKSSGTIKRIMNSATSRYKYTNISGGRAGGKKYEGRMDLSTPEKNEVLDVMSGILGIKATDFDTHRGYKDALTGGTVAMYNEYQNQMQEMLDTDPSKRGDTKFGQLSTVKKAEVIQLSKLIGNSELGEDLGLISFDSMMGGNSDSSLYSKKELESMKNVGEDTSKKKWWSGLDPSKKGLSKWVMDPSNALSEGGTDAFTSWVFDGKRIKYGGLATGAPGKSTGAMSITELEEDINKQINNVSEEYSEAYYKNENIKNKLSSGGKYSSMFSGEESALISQVLNGEKSGAYLSGMGDKNVEGKDERKRLIDEIIELSKKMKELNEGNIVDLKDELKLFNELKSQGKDMATLSTVFSQVMYGNDEASRNKFLNESGTKDLTNPEDMSFEEIQDALKTGMTVMMDEMTKSINTDVGGLVANLSETLGSDLTREIMAEIGSFDTTDGTFTLNDGVTPEEAAKVLIDALTMISSSGEAAAEQVEKDVESTVSKFESATEKYDATLTTWMDANQGRISQIEKKIDFLEKTQDPIIATIANLKTVLFGGGGAKP